MSRHKMSPIGAALLLQAAGLASLDGFPLPKLGQPDNWQPLTDEDHRYLASLDRGGRDIWMRRFARGLSPSEREFVNKKISELI